MKRKRNLILIVAAIIVIVAMIVFLQFNRNRIQSVKFNGYETSEEAIKKYLDAFVKKDSESVMSSYCPKGMEKAAADQEVSVEKLYKKEMEQLDEILKNREQEITGYKYSLEKELSEDEIEKLFEGYEPERACSYEVSFTSEEFPQNSKFRIYTVCYGKAWYIMNLENIIPDDFYMGQ